MDKLKELETTKANFISEMEKYKKHYKELLCELLEKYNLHKDCEWRGKKGRFKIVEDRYCSTSPYEINFYAYTKKGVLSQKASAWLHFYCINTDEEFKEYIAKEGIKAVEDNNNEDRKTD